MMAFAGVVMWSGAEKVDAVASIESAQESQAVEVKVVEEPKISREELSSLLSSGNLIGLEARTNEVLSKNPNDPFALFMQGHIKMERNQYKEALNTYAMAISGETALANDKRYAKNLVARLSYDAAKVTELTKLAPSKPVVSELVKRTLIEGNRSLRNDAAYILNVAKKSKKVDVVAMALLDLKESKSCADKNQAIKILGEQQDPRALPALEKITKTNLIQRLKVGCLVKSAKIAVKAIEAKLAK